MSLVSWRPLPDPRARVDLPDLQLGRGAGRSEIAWKEHGRTRPTGFEPVTFGFVGRRLPLESLVLKPKVTARHVQGNAEGNEGVAFRALTVKALGGGRP